MMFYRYNCELCLFCDNGSRGCMFISLLGQVLRNAESHFQPGKGYTATVVCVDDDNILELSLTGTIDVKLTFKLLMCENQQLLQVKNTVKYHVKKFI